MHWLINRIKVMYKLNFVNKTMNDFKLCVKDNSWLGCNIILDEWTEGQINSLLQPDWGYRYCVQKFSDRYSNYFYEKS